MKTIPINRDEDAKSWVVGIDAKDLIDYMAGGARFTHRRLECDNKDGQGLAAEFCISSVFLFDEKWVAVKPRVVMYIEQPDTKPPLTIEEAVSMVDVLIKLCNVSSVIWGLAITGGSCYAVNMLIEHK